MRPPSHGLEQLSRIRTAWRAAGVNESGLAIVGRGNRGGRYRKPCGCCLGAHRDMSANNICSVEEVGLPRVRRAGRFTNG
jgi:hypothetical protein